MVQTNKQKELLELLKPTFGSASELSKEIGNAALDVAVTPLVDITDYQAVQKAIYIMWEIKKALDVIAQQEDDNK